MNFFIGATMIIGAFSSPVDYAAVTEDIKAMLTVNQPNVDYTQDFGNYGPFFVRLAWHSSGSYRSGDGRGGSDGGRIRFAPERDWPDNGNLDHARELLQGVKDKYPNLSWADLIVLSGVAAVDAMGGPNIGFCGGRVDDMDGTASLPLGPGPEQMIIAPCAKDGNCGSNGEINGGVELGLIYVNPEGVHAANGTIIPDPKLSANDVRGTFARMGMDDRETVALCGGGHAFGKFHGDSAGTFTSGFEGPWSNTPTVWGNKYFDYINRPGWMKQRNPKNTNANSPYQWHSDDVDITAIRMLTSDLALGLAGADAPYMQISAEYRDDIQQFEEDFGKAWYKLLSRDMGPHARCKGNLVPEPQPWQLPLPAANTNYPNWAGVSLEVMAAMDTPEKTSSLINLAYQCAVTYRSHDYMGGCNGAFILQEPVKSFVDQNMVESTKAMLMPIKEKFTTLSWADLIVFAGQLAVEKTLGVSSTKFCPGRSDFVGTLSAAQEQQLSFLKVRTFDNKTVELSELRLRLDMTSDEIRAVLELNGVTTYDSEFTGQLQDATTIKAAAWTKLMNLDRFEVDCAADSIDVPYSDPEVDYAAITEDIKAMLTVNQPNVDYTQDFGNYGPFFVRLAWHSSGSYRSGDGRGGSDGGRIRFAPERDWPDNGNLDHARELLQGVKDKYPNLSWADLIVLSGVAAVDAMGGPNIGFCGGRVDDMDGTASLPLGPGPEQMIIAPCAKDGNCGSNGEINGGVELGLIYVNPEGVHAANGTIIPDPKLSANDVRGTFARMGMDDRETVALCGGGHAFGKFHGDSAGTFTSGFEGPWSNTPTVWGNKYFDYINRPGWMKQRNPKNTNANSPYQWHSDDVDITAIRMLTSDLALGLAGADAPYMQISAEYRDDIQQFEEDFGKAWYKLLSRDMGPHARCKGNLVPEPQPWQLPLPAANTNYPNWAGVSLEVMAAMDTPEKTSSLINLAYQCAVTYRSHDYMGGCNGAFILQEPVKSFVDQNMVESTKAMLMPIKEKFTTLSWADLIVFAGQLAVEKTLGVSSTKFCPGRSDFVGTLSAAQEQQLSFLKVRTFDNKTVELSELRLRLDMTSDEIRAVLELNGVTTYDSEFTGQLQDATTVKAAAWTKLMNLDRFEVDCAADSIDIPEPTVHTTEVPDITTEVPDNTTIPVANAGSTTSPLFLLLGFSVFFV